MTWMCENRDKLYCTSFHFPVNIAKHFFSLQLQSCQSTGVIWTNGLILDVCWVCARRACCARASCFQIAKMFPVNVLNHPSMYVICFLRKCPLHCFRTVGVLLLQLQILWELAVPVTSNIFVRVHISSRQHKQRPHCIMLDRSNTSRMVSSSVWTEKHALSQESLWRLYILDLRLHETTTTVWCKKTPAVELSWL